jgi:hypothetical protein
VKDVVLLLSLPSRRQRVPIYIVRDIQASQGEWPKHIREGRDKVDEHEEADGMKQTREKEQEQEHETETEKRIEVRWTNVHAYK